MKKGYTLIELIMVLSLIGVMLSIGFISFKGINNYKKYTEVEYTNNLILNFIDECRQFSRENSVQCSIVFDIPNSLVYLEKDTKILKELQLKEYIKLSSTNFSPDNNVLKVNKRGYLVNSGTITFLSKEGSTHIITICVGSGYVSIKE